MKAFLRVVLTNPSIAIPLGILGLLLAYLFLNAPKAVGPVMSIFLIGAAVGLLHLITSRKVPPPWRKDDQDTRDK
ncbi:hypothetical protein IMW82_13000 [Rhodanobacter sp. B2A1Ga4]|jgi:hypothetical protein|uniref:hypothetical protein n=1 Tax=Rhodanobacter sp. B2A1Ga4 TaxID=2778647 RepID=UPI001B394055|nr:hypothetical protein [Rhodanobacter sp. B2A1Ga4]MBQ4855589.1 hypothetical protein [Rhodanobacter sp. B2A1Ga4]